MAPPGADARCRQLRRRGPRPDAARHGRPRRLPRSCARSARGTADAHAHRARRRHGPRSSASSSAPTTTCPSRSSRASCWRGSRRSCAAAAAARDDDVLRFGRLEIDLGARVVRLDGKPSDLTGHQFDLLLALAQQRRPRALARPAHGRAARASRSRPSTARSTSTSRASAPPSRTIRSSRAASSPCAAPATCSPRRRTDSSMRHLYHQLYLTIIASLLLVVLIAGVLAARAERPPGPRASRSPAS